MQLRGDVVDTRADVYAIGAVLYEMAAGRKAFREESAPRLIDAILHEPPVPPRHVNPRTSAELERIILKCLDKEAENRYQSARELGIDMRRVGTGPGPPAPLRRPAGIRWPVISTLSLAVLLLLTALIALTVGDWHDRLRGAGSVPRIKSLAVLPLANLSGVQEYLADGMTDTLITDLGKIGAPRAISRTSVMQYKGGSKPLREIAKDLSLDAVVEGSLLRSGGRVQITARLIQAKTDTRIWSQSYERDVQDANTCESWIYLHNHGQPALRLEWRPQSERFAFQASADICSSSLHSRKRRTLDTPGPGCIRVFSGRRHPRIRYLPICLHDAKGLRLCENSIRRCSQSTSLSNYFGC